MRDFFKILSVLFVSLIYFKPGFSQTSWKGTTSGNWSIASNWTNGIPDSTKDVILGDANFTGTNQPILNVYGYCKSIKIAGAVPTTLTINFKLLVVKDFTINNNGTVVHDNAIITLRGNWINSGSYTNTHINAKINFSGAAQSIGGASVTTFNRVLVEASSLISLQNNVNITAASSYLIVYGTIDPGQSPTYKITSSISTKVYDLGKLLVKAPTFPGNYNLSGSTSLYGGSVVEYCSTVSDQIVSSAYSYSTLIISGTGTKSLTSNLPFLYSLAMTTGNIYVNSGTFDVGIYTANRKAFVAGGELRVANGAFLKIAGANNFPLNFITRVFQTGSTVNYYGAIDQNISVQTYGNLLISGTGNKNANMPLTIMGNLLVNSAILNTGAFTVTHAVAGDLIMTGGAISGTNATYKLTGAVDQQLILLSNLTKLTVEKSSGSILLGSNITVSNTLNFVKGSIQTGSYKVIIPSTAAVSGADQSTGWVNGNLQKNVTTGNSIYRTFEVGGTSDYSPAAVLFVSVTAAGTLTANAGSVDQPEINYSGIDPEKSVNRFWSFTNSGILFSTATSTFNWVPSAIDAGAIPSDFKAGIFNGTTWTLPGITDIQPTSIKATGLTSFGDFAVGEGISLYTWNGDALTSDWFTPKNWVGGVPTTTYRTFIPAGLIGGRSYPVLTGTAMVDDITVENGSTLTVDGGTLQFIGRVSSSGAIIASAGTIEFNGTAPQVIPPGIFANNTIRNLIIANEVSLADADTITGTLTIAPGKTFYTNDHLVLKSSATGTARIANLPVDGSGVATAFITGKVSIERYIPARKAWRLLSAPIKPGVTSINAAWQEGVNGSSFGPNPNPGYGVHIAGGSILNGFDQSPTNLPTIKVYDNGSDAYVGLPPFPGTNVPMNNYPGYLLYIRGDRSIDLMQGANAAVTSTTLRIKGEVNTGNKTVNVNAGNFSVMGNPYPSAIDFQTLSRNNVKNTFYIWDPKLAGENGLGGYVTASWNSTTNSYDFTTSASPVSQYIPSGEAILVQSQDGTNPGTITIKEADKTTNGSDMMFGRPAGMNQKLRANLHAVNRDGSSSLLDAALTTYHDDHSNIVDNEDVKKLKSTSERIGLQREINTLAIERRKTITGNDTAFLNLGQMKAQTYKLEFITENLSRSGLIAVLEDTYSNTINNMPVDLNGATSVEFSINSDPASYAANRFRIVFRKDLPVSGNAKAAQAVAKLNEGKAIQAEKMIVFPNPVTGNTVTLQLNNLNKAVYNVQLADMNGQVVKTFSLQHSGFNTIHTFKLDSYLPSGNYLVKLTGSTISLVTSMIKE